MTQITGTPDVAAMMARLKLTSELAGIKKQIDGLGSDPLAMLTKLKLVARSNEIRKQLGATVATPDVKPEPQESEHIKTLKAVAAGEHDGKGVAELFGVIQEACNALANDDGQVVGEAEVIANEAITHWAELEERLSAAVN